MSHSSDKTNMVSDAVLDIIIHRVQEELSALLELKELRTKEIRIHTPIHCRTRPNGNITSVLCSCGFETKYRVPLNDLKDFECPRKGK